MFDKVFCCSMIAHAIKYDINPFASCKFCCGDEIGVGGDDYNLVNLLLERQ